MEPAPSVADDLPWYLSPTAPRTKRGKKKMMTLIKNKDVPAGTPLRLVAWLKPS